jgi:NAD-dependent dihydropyrimidine dehydrogenase PreA subunit
MAYVIAEPCIGVTDKACVDACPVDCIHPGQDEAGFTEVQQLYIDADKCICCGACVPVCPVSAIFLAEDLPLQWKGYVQTNAEWYASQNAPQLA